LEGLSAAESQSPAKIRRIKQLRLNDLKYELMVLNQNLGTTVPGSKLADEMVASRFGMQSEIARLEQELSEKPVPKAEPQFSEDIKKVKDEKGKVRIWSSSSSG
jgi:hypothetical protein